MYFIHDIINFIVSCSVVELVIRRSHKNSAFNGLTHHKTTQNKYKFACVAVLGAFLKRLTNCSSRILPSGQKSAEAYLIVPVLEALNWVLEPMTDTQHHNYHTKEHPTTNLSTIPNQVAALPLPYLGVVGILQALHTAQHTTTIWHLLLFLIFASPCSLLWSAIDLFLSLRRVFILILVRSVSTRWALQLINQLDKAFGRTKTKKTNNMVKMRQLISCSLVCDVEFGRNRQLSRDHLLLMILNACLLHMRVVSLMVDIIF